jgi:hypothetical protein
MLKSCPNCGFEGQPGLDFAANAGPRYSSNATSIWRRLANNRFQREARRREQLGEVGAVARLIYQYVTVRKSCGTGCVRNPRLPSLTPMLSGG